MPTVIIRRANAHANRLRVYSIYIDGIKAATIANGDTINVPIDAGKHTIKATLDWWRSPITRFTLTDNETKLFTVSGSKKGNRLLMFILLSMLCYYIVKLGFGAEGLMVSLMLLPSFLIVTYFITLGRKKYLVLKEDKV